MNKYLLTTIFILFSILIVGVICWLLMPSGEVIQDWGDLKVCGVMNGF
jgi:hypothetical protein